MNNWHENASGQFVSINKYNRDQSPVELFKSLIQTFTMLYARDKSCAPATETDSFYKLQLPKRMI